MNLKLLCIIFFLGGVLPSFSFIDSVGTETLNGKLIILHKVEAKETLYSLSRRYNISVDAIKIINPGAEMGISLGQILKIPTEKKAPNLNEEKTKTVNESNIYHTVKPGETLYAISTLYPSTVDEIKQWNKLTSNAIDVGKRLIVGKSSNTPLIKEPIEKEAVEEVLEETINDLKATTTDGREVDIDLSVKTKAEIEAEKSKNDRENTERLLNQSDASTDSLPSKKSVDMGGYTKVFEKGYAILMEGTMSDERYLANHKTLPEGTILQVKNIENGKSVFVRVVSKLNHSDPKVIISLSKKAETRLGSENSTFLTEISYIP